MISDPTVAERPEIEQAIVDWRAKRAERLLAQKAVDKLHEQEQALKSWLMEVFKEQKLEGMIIDQRSTGLVTREVHSVTDKEAVVDYIIDNRAIELLQFRLSEGAIVEREDAGEAIPGLELVDVYDLFDRKA